MEGRLSRLLGSLIGLMIGVWDGVESLLQHTKALLQLSNITTVASATIHKPSAVNIKLCSTQLLLLKIRKSPSNPKFFASVKLHESCFDNIYFVNNLFTLLQIFA